MCATSLGWHHLVNTYGVKAGWLIPFVDKHGWQVKLCDSSLMCAILECIRGVYVMRYTNFHLLYFTYTILLDSNVA